MMTATDCPTSDQLRLYAVGRLGEVESEQLFEHLSHCDECQSQLETVDDGQDSLLGELRSADEPDPFVEEEDCRVAIAKALGSLAQVGSGFADLPREIGDYELIRPIARGGMGEVYLARHTRLAREVAIKVIAGTRSSDARTRERFEAEMRAVGRLSHPNIVAALDARDVEGVAVLVTEYVDGFDLGELVSRVGPLSTADSCEIIRKVAAALQYTSDQGFVHRDVKPSNIMVSREGEVKLLDLGLARLSEGEERSVDLTATGQAIGTADYVAPEQVTDGRSVDCRADIYSLGCTLFKLLTGHAPFADELHTTAYAKMNAHVSSEPPRISDHGDWSSGLVKLVDSMLAKNVEKRPQKPQDVAAAVSALSEGYDLVALVKHATECEPKTETMMRSSLPKSLPWFRRNVPISAAIATGFIGILFGLLCGLFIKITYRDGTSVVLPIDGAQVEVTNSDGQEGQPSIPLGGATAAKRSEAIALSHIKATEAVALLKRLLGDQTSNPMVTGDPKGNKVLVRGSTDQIGLVKRLIEELDRDGRGPDVRVPADSSAPIRDMLSMFDGFWQLSGEQVGGGGRPPETLSGDEVLLAIGDGRVSVAAYREGKASLLATGAVLKKDGRFVCELEKSDGTSIGEVIINRSGSLGAAELSLRYLPGDQSRPGLFQQQYQQIGDFPEGSSAVSTWIESLDLLPGSRVDACLRLIQSELVFAEGNLPLSQFEGYWRLGGSQVRGQRFAALVAEEVVMFINDGRVLVAAYVAGQAEIVAMGQVVQRGERFSCNLKKPEDDSYEELWIDRIGGFGPRISLHDPTVNEPFGLSQEYDLIGPTVWDFGENESVSSQVLACVALIQSRWSSEKAAAELASLDGIWQPTWKNSDPPATSLFSGEHVIVGILGGEVRVVAIRTGDAELVASGTVVQKQGDLVAELSSVDQSQTETMPIIRVGTGKGSLRLLHAIQLPREDRAAWAVELSHVTGYPKDERSFDYLMGSLSKESWLRDCLEVIKQNQPVAVGGFEGVWVRKDSKSQSTAYLALQDGKWFGVGFNGEQPPELDSGKYRIQKKSSAPLAWLTYEGETSMVEAAISADGEMVVSTINRDGMGTRYRRLCDLPSMSGEFSLTGLTPVDARAVRMLHELGTRGEDHVKQSNERLLRIAESKNKLRGIGVAMHVHQTEIGSIPGSAFHQRVGEVEKGNAVVYPMSWRVALLPYIGFPQLYEEYRTDEPWDGPNNRKLLTRMPSCYQSPFSGNELAIGHTTYLGFATDESMLGGEPGKSRQLNDVSDAPGETLLVVDAKKSVPWTKPEDLDEVRGEDLRFPLLMVMADGSVRHLEKPDIDLIKKMVTRAGGEAIAFPSD